MTRLHLTFVASAATVFLAMVTTGGGAASERWSAVSSTALAITGDVTFAPSRITFANHAHVDLAFAATLHRAAWAGLVTAGTPIALYRIVGNRDPVLARGNRLCGSRPRFASVVRKRRHATSPQSDDVTLAVFTGNPVPPGQADARLCATYRFEARRAGY